MSNLHQTDRTIPTQEAESFDFAPFLGIFIFVAFLLLLGLYIWGNSLNTNKVNNAPLISTERPSRAENTEPEATRANADTDALQVMSPSDQLEAIEADLAGTNLESLNQELTAIQAELEAALEETIR